MDYRVLHAAGILLSSLKLEQNISKLKTPSKQNEFMSEIHNLSCDGSWNLLKRTVYEVHSKSLGFVMEKHQD